MPAVLLFVFVVQLALSLLSTVGAQTVNSFVWFLFTKLPIPQSKQAEENGKLRREVVRLQRELHGVSAQDNFAKWARLRRDHDKVREKYDRESRDEQAFRSMFDRAVSALRWIGVQAVNFLVNTYYSKEPMFWLPQGWVPYQAEWVLSCPRAPLGSISVNVWALACGSVIAMVSEAVMAIWTLKAGEVKTGPNRGEKLKTETPAKPVLSEKKEL